jgi:hypothetical protein
MNDVVEELAWRAARCTRELPPVDQEEALREFHVCARPEVVLRLIAYFRHQQETIEQVREWVRGHGVAKPVAQLLRERQRLLEAL